MLVRTELDNPNCEWIEGRLFQERSDPRRVRKVLRLRNGVEVWCSVEGVEAGGTPCPAQARKVDDSGEGTCYLVTGGAWGLRLTAPDGAAWGEAFLLLPPDGADLHFLDEH